jgi:Holliday junction resolvasome RuvABC endonuclease subunit
MIILGIDPAYRGPAGFAVIETRQPTHAMLVAVEVLTFERGAPTADRMPLLWDRADALILAHSPAAVACETAYQGVNAATSLGLAEAIGGLHSLVRRSGRPFLRVTESQQRATAQSYPRALIQRWLGHIDPRLWEHAVDAIAIAQVAAGEAARLRMSEQAESIS